MEFNFSETTLEYIHRLLEISLTMGKDRQTKQRIGEKPGYLTNQIGFLFFSGFTLFIHIFLFFRITIFFFIFVFIF